jgi:hypothetical protein
MDSYRTLINTEVIGMNSWQVENLDGTGCSDWEERKSYEGIIPAVIASERIHNAIVRQVKHQIILIGVNSAGDNLCSLIIISE